MRFLVTSVHKVSNFLAIETPLIVFVGGFFQQLGGEIHWDFCQIILGLVQRVLGSGVFRETSGSVVVYSHPCLHVLVSGH